ncbi:DUF3649 domain-containing protein [Xanthomonas sp. NCPPB 2654]|uniref:DUF3649 domain-containing protein n=1 Tax=unclassified Xanthomonas TaxID=2643310 RepID=UPI0021E0F18A|nr:MULTISPECIES: DUF3649 domain-containing protein [unclassified Xanthomonas]MDL5365676.1 DUF3649 domain-containing protein [Xanthomonas sp. NCPPB 2654]UYC22728.1 DUF3649 domain-containing protein [Xanthomonas sp. CFBP 8443]
MHPVAPAPLHDPRVPGTTATPRRPLPPWLGVLSRSVAAIFGGYALAAATSALLPLLWPSLRAQAVLSGMMLGILVCACTALWAFATRSAARAWLGILAVLAPMALAIAWLQQHAP